MASPSQELSGLSAEADPEATLDRSFLEEETVSKDPGSVFTALVQDGKPEMVAEYGRLMRFDQERIVHGVVLALNARVTRSQQELLELKVLFDPTANDDKESRWAAATKALADSRESGDMRTIVETFLFFGKINQRRMVELKAAIALDTRMGATLEQKFGPVVVEPEDPLGSPINVVEPSGDE